MKRTILILISVFISVSLSAQPLRIGVAGVTHDHLGGVVSALQGGDVEVVGVWESDARYLHNNVLSGRIPESLFYAELGQMLDQTRPEAVVAYGSIKDHLAVVEACAPRGIHVMVEKPLGSTLKDAVRMASLARKYGILLLTNYETSWYASNTYVKQQVEAGNLGKLFRIDVYDGHEGPFEIGCSQKFLDWLTDPVLNGGGAVIDFGCYGANLATWLLDGQVPDKVFAVLRQNKPAVYPKVDDDAEIILQYGDVTVNIGASWCWPTGRKDMYVYGLNGYLYQRTPERVSGLREGKFIPEFSAPAIPAPYDNSFRYLKAAVRGEITVQPDDLGALDNNLTVMRILDAAIRSSQQGKAVTLR
jgi:predicted dehydrogenase